MRATPFRWGLMQQPLQNQIVQKTIFPVLFTISFTHLLNDLIQAVLPSVYPLFKTNFNLSFTQIGLITLTVQLTASLLQPFVGIFSDRNPKPFLLATAMVFTLAGLIFVAYAPNYIAILVAVCFLGIGSSIFHPEASKVAYMAAGNRRGLAQSIFQLGGNTGSAIGPLLAALIVMPYGQYNIVWFSVAAILGVIILIKIGNWYKGNLALKAKSPALTIEEVKPDLSAKKVNFSIFILLMLIFSKYVYLASMTSYFTFYLIDKFHVSVQYSQVHLFMFLAAVAVGTVLGGGLGDKYGRKYVIWISILGAAPFTLMLPYANLFWTGALSIIIGVIISSAFSAILVFAQELMPGKIGLISGLFFGFAFGMGGLGSAILGVLADHTSINYVFWVCSFLPLIGVITGFLPNIEGKKLRVKQV
jgi:FSR family fosmidomycin resistance protein-like MFS transporter